MFQSTLQSMMSTLAVSVLRDAEASTDHIEAFTQVEPPLRGLLLPIFLLLMCWCRFLVVGLAPRQLEQSSKPDDCSSRSNQPTACGPSESILDVGKSSLPNFRERSCQGQVAHAILHRKLN